MGLNLNLPVECQSHPVRKRYDGSLIGMARGGSGRLPFHGEGRGRRFEAVKRGAVVAKKPGQGGDAFRRGKVGPGFFEGHRIELRRTATSVATRRAPAFGGLGRMRGTVGPGEKFGLPRGKDSAAESCPVVQKLHHRKAVEMIFETLDEVSDSVKKMLWSDGRADVPGGLRYE